MKCFFYHQGGHKRKNIVWEKKEWQKKTDSVSC